jgi:hypothetical protein
MEPVERFGYGCTGPCPVFDDIEEIPCMNEHIGFL